MDSRCFGSQLKNFIQPCLLLLLKEEPDYGYDLVARLRPFGVSDSAAVYRALRGLETYGAVTSKWKQSAAGPARRMYHLTAEGETALEEWAASLVSTKRTVEGYLVRYEVAKRAADHPSNTRRNSGTEAVRG